LATSDETPAMATFAKLIASLKYFGYKTRNGNDGMLHLLGRCGESSAITPIAELAVMASESERFDFPRGLSVIAMCTRRAVMKRRVRSCEDQMKG
jgi:hypothetical protein